MKAREQFASFLTIAGSLLAFANAVHASDSRGFVISWFYPAMNSQNGDCGPDGINPSGEKLFERILNTRNMTPHDREEALHKFPESFSAFATERGTIDGKPVNIYMNPTAEPDPHIKIARGKVGYGFNLDGREGTDDFVDIESGERGVDNRLARAVGCFESMRGTPTARPSYPAGHWSQPADYMQAWVIEVSGVDNWQNDDEVKVGIYRAIEPIVRSVTSEPQADMTFRIDLNPHTWNEMRGQLKSGVLVTDPIDFNMIGDPYGIVHYRFRSARLRLKFASNGTADGIIGGYFYWMPLYMNFALGGGNAESTLSIDAPGLYYALRRLAEIDPDPKSGVNMGISAAYRIEAIPAFLTHIQAAETHSHEREPQSNDPPTGVRD